MNKYWKIELQRAILQIDNPYPKDDFIVSYSDFLKARDYLGYYKFNPVVFNHLVMITNNEWATEKRISRLSLILKVKQYYRVALEIKTNDYYQKAKKKPVPLSFETRKQLFEIFKKTFEESKHISNKQLEEARKFCNSLIINIEFTTLEEEWFCNNAFVSELILNRVLRYPTKSSKISNWAKINFTNNNLVTRRAELISWLVDEDPNFEINQQVLIDDFEYLNQSDLQAIQNYDDEIIANKIIADELRDYVPKTQYYSILDGPYQGANVELSNPELKLNKRPYSIPHDQSKTYPVDIPDFEKLRDEFYSNILIHQKVTMIWGIAYSRLDNELQADLLKKYYCEETYYSLLKVSKRTKNSKILKWILEQQ